MPDSIPSLEQEIGYSSFSGKEIPITDNQRDLIIKWMVLKGVEVNRATNNSNQTLSKAYAFPKYLSAILKTQKEEKYKVKGKRVPNFSFQARDSSEKQIPASIWEIKTPVIGQALDLDLEHNPTKTLIEEETKKTIKEILSDELIANRQVLNSSLNKFNDNFLRQIKEKIVENTMQVAKIAGDIAKQITNDRVESEIQTQIENLKKQVEDIIFQGYINHRKNNPKPQVSNSEPEIINSDSELNSSFIPKLDPNYHFDPYASKVIRSALSMRENLYVYGDTGCGKTTHLEQICAVLNRGLIRVNPHDGITREMFLGGMKLINNETIFVEGALPLAMRNGYVFLVDEISFLPPNLTAILNPIGEKGGKLYIPETSEWITPAPGFCIFATDNTGGKGDRSGQYTGTEVQNTATLDRFAFCIKMDYLPQDKEKEMLEKRFPNQDQSEIERMLSFAQNIRNAFSRGELSITFSTRKLIKFFDQRNNNFTIQEALSNTILSWLDEDDETLVKTIIDRLDLLESIEAPKNNNQLTNLDMFQKHIDKKELVSAMRIYRLVHSVIDLRTAKVMVENILSGIIDINSEKENIKWFEPYTGVSS